MGKLAFVAVLAGLTLGQFAEARAEARKRDNIVRQEAVSVRSPAGARVGSWIASAGLGLFFDPTLLLLNPQLEYVWKPNIYVGPHVQLGVGDGTVFTGSVTVRIVVGRHRVKPCLETGLGLAVAGNQVGLHIPIGMGMDYQLEPGISIGTMFRGNFMPPARTFMVSWPIVVGRFAL